MPRPAYVIPFLIFHDKICNYLMLNSYYPIRFCLVMFLATNWILMQTDVEGSLYNLQYLLSQNLFYML